MFSQPHKSPDREELEIPFQIGKLGGHLSDFRILLIFGFFLIQLIMMMKSGAIRISSVSSISSPLLAIPLAVIVSIVRRGEK